MKMLESMDIPRNRIIDGRVFRIPNLDFQRLRKEGIAYGTFEPQLSHLYHGVSFRMSPTLYVSYPQVYTFRYHKVLITLNRYSYISVGPTLMGNGEVSIGSFCSIAAENVFRFGGNHHYQCITNSSAGFMGWKTPQDWKLPEDAGKIQIGNDVWTGWGSRFKNTNPDKPLIIGDGAVIASDSVVVKNVPPYAIVGGNPARIIRYRFSDKVIEGLLRIKWWDWDIDKIHDNFKYFNRVEEFVAIHDTKSFVNNFKKKPIL